MNNLDNLNKCDCSIVITDPCKELQHKVKVNKKAYIFNPMDIQNTIGYNPLDNCKNESDVEKIASVILENGVDENSQKELQQWIDMSLSLISSFLIAIWDSEIMTFSDAIKFLMNEELTRSKESMLQLIKYNK